MNKDLLASRCVLCIFSVAFDCLYGRGCSAWVRGILEKIADVAHCDCLSVHQQSLICFLLAGSEGKLTVVAQKMSVLSGEDPKRKLLL